MTNTKPGLHAVIATMSEDMQQNLRTAERLVNTIGMQQDEVESAYQRGWRECSEALSYIGFDMWTAGFVAGRADKEREIDATWKEVADRSHFLGSPRSKTHAERRAAELAACQPRPGDFPGVEADPHCLERVRASMEPIARTIRRAA